MLFEQGRLHSVPFHSIVAGDDANWNETLDLRPFLVIQILGFLTAQVWACIRLRHFGLEFMAKLEALVDAGYVPIPLPHEMSEYLKILSVLKTGGFFTFTLGFTLGIVGWVGAFGLDRCKFSWVIRLVAALLVSLVFAFFVGFSLLELSCFLAFFGVAYVAIRVPEARLHKLALLALVPLLAIPLLYESQDFFRIRDSLLQTGWGMKAVAFYYRYSPFSAELITPPAERAQVAVWTGSSIGKAEKKWLLQRGIYPVGTAKRADVTLSEDVRTGPAVLQAVRDHTGGVAVRRLRSVITYSIFASAPLALMLLLIGTANYLLLRFKKSKIAVLFGIGILSALLVGIPLLRDTPEAGSTLTDGALSSVRQWVVGEEKTYDGETRTSLEGLLESTNPAVRLWAAAGLADLPSKENVQILMKVARQDPVAIVRCKAIFALSHQKDRRVLPFLEGRLKGEEDWYVKHYLLRGLRRMGWAG